MLAGAPRRAVHPIAAQEDTPAVLAGDAMAARAAGPAELAVLAGGVDGVGDGRGRWRFAAPVVVGHGAVVLLF
jgi:hypothetical protein